METSDKIDRYGYIKGKYTAPVGTPFEQRAIQSKRIHAEYNVYEVVKPIENVKFGKAAPWFGKEGGGTQFKMPKSIKELLKDGYIK